MKHGWPRGRVERKVIEVGGGGLRRGKSGDHHEPPGEREMAIFRRSGRRSTTEGLEWSTGTGPAPRPRLYEANKAKWASMGIDARVYNFIKTLSLVSAVVVLEVGGGSANQSSLISPQCDWPPEQIFAFTSLVLPSQFWLLQSSGPA